MALDEAQKLSLKTAIDADPALSSQPQTPDGAFAIAAAFNLNASPDFTVWKSNVSIAEVGAAIDADELSGLPTNDATRLDTFSTYNQSGVKPAKADRRSFFDNIFAGAGGATTRANLAVLWKRLATRAEALFAVGTGTDTDPATLTFEGVISYQDVVAARAL